MENTIVMQTDPERDSKYIAELINICIDEKRTILNPYSEEEEKLYLNNLQNREAVFVAYIKHEFAGFAGVAPRWGYSEKLRHCGEPGTWVMPKCRGKGVGKALWLYGILPWCEKQGFSHLGALVMAHNVGSIGFYEKMGFQVCGYHRKIVNWEREMLDAVEIERVLI